MLSERINQKNETRKNEGRNDDLVSDEKGTSAISGKNSEIVNFYLYYGQHPLSCFLSDHYFYIIA